MAGPTQQTDADRKRIAQGLMAIISGSSEDLSAVDRMSDGGVRVLVETNSQQIDANIRPARRPVQGLSSFRATPPPADEPGARDRALELIRRERMEDPNQRLQTPRERESLQALIGAAGYSVTFDDKIDETERSFLPQLEERLRRGQSLGSLFNENAGIERASLEQQRRTAAENALAQEQQTALNNKFTAGLVYAGYLKPQDINDPNAAAIAMNNMIVNTTQRGELANEQERIFRNPNGNDWRPTQYALDFLNRNTAGMALRDPSNPARDRLESDLESTDTRRITLAQNYLALRGENVTPNGIVDNATAEAGQRAITQPLALPPGMIVDGRINYMMLHGMAAAGQLYLPESALTQEERDAAQAYKPADERINGLGMSREAFVATRLIARDPSRYEAILATENERRAGATLDVVSRESVAPVVRENQQTLQAVALPANLAETAVRYARDHGGEIRVEHIPYILGQARGDATTMNGGIDHARIAGQRAGLTPDQLSASIKLDPSSATFTEDMNRFLQTSYVLQNARAGARLDNIPADISQQLQQVAQAQSRISTSLVDRNLTEIGLPQNILTNMRNVASREGNLMLVQLPNVMLTTDRTGIGQKVTGRNYGSMVTGTGIEGMSGDPAIDAINARDGRINVNDPRELAVGMQMIIAMRDGKSLDEVRARPGLRDQTLAVAQGYLGNNTPAATPAPREERPAPSEAPPAVVAGNGQGWLGRIFGIGAQAAPAQNPALAQQQPDSRPVAVPTQDPWVYTPGG